MPHPRLITVLLTLTAALPVAGVSLWSIHRSALEFSDRCAKWSDPADDQAMPVAATIGPHDVCRAVTVHSGSKVHAAITAALVPGGLLAAAILGVVGAVLSRRRMMLAAAAGMLAESLVVLTVAPLTLLVGVSFLLVARRLQPG